MGATQHALTFLDDKWHVVNNNSQRINAKLTGNNAAVHTFSSTKRPNRERSDAYCMYQNLSEKPLHVHGRRTYLLSSPGGRAQHFMRSGNAVYEHEEDVVPAL